MELLLSLGEVFEKFTNARELARPTQEWEKQMISALNIRILDV